MLTNEQREQLAKNVDAVLDKIDGPVVRVVYQGIDCYLAGFDSWGFQARLCRADDLEECDTLEVDEATFIQYVLSVFSQVDISMLEGV
jgi:hypothetical protein